MKVANKKLIVISILGIIVVLATAICLFLTMSDKAEYEVSFYNDEGTLLSVEKVKRNSCSNFPNNPSMSYGKIFQSWDTSFAKVKKDLQIKPHCADFAGKANTFALSGAYGQKDQYVIVPFQLCGNVCLSGFDLTISYDSAILELQSVFNEDGGVIYNSEKAGQIKMNYVSTQNTMGDVDICSLKFKVKSNDQEKTPVNIAVDKVYAVKDDDSIYSAEYSIIDSYVYLLK